jgi:hypothetical protein
LLPLAKAATRKFAAERWDLAIPHVLPGLIVAKLRYAPTTSSHSASSNHGHAEYTSTARAGTVANRAYLPARAATFVETDQSDLATLGDGGSLSLQRLAKWGRCVAHHPARRKRDDTRAAPATLASGPTIATTPGEDNLVLQAVVYASAGFSIPISHAAWHTGSTSGSAPVMSASKDDLTVIVLCNRTDLDSAARALQAADFYLKASN